MVGYNHVDNLTRFLIGLLDVEVMYLNNEQVEEFIGLWEKLHPIDKQKAIYEANAQDGHLKGKFRSPKKKKAVCIPGVESTAR